ncbi:hypothetical protein B0H67DRAFT_645013 [Lasiosphaeris hirsuta]|uniref:Uncharacterized protein n=1 Tax=Lasiosphaeris hirsuta TaxID=260670 RepID=A0AA40DTS8_9PEZI|nr:hypothetical protein B0H67DRAFT_645013 [Lasiosphaeris hirsuta]
MHRGLVEHPIADDPSGNVIDGRPKKTIRSWVSTIYEAVRDGSLSEEVLGFLASGTVVDSLDKKGSNGNGTSEVAVGNGILHRDHVAENGAANGHGATDESNSEDGVVL